MNYRNPTMIVLSTLLRRAVFLSRVILRCASLAVFTLPLLDAGDADAACNAIPGTIQAFRAAQGTIDRPFAGPDEFVTLRVDTLCDDVSPGFTANPGDHVVTVVFNPPAGPPNRHNVVVITTDCAAVESARAACEARADVSTASCLQVNGSNPIGLEVRGSGPARRLLVRFPDTDRVCSAGTNAGHVCRTLRRPGPTGSLRLAAKSP